MKMYLANCIRALAFITITLMSAVTFAQDKIVPQSKGQVQLSYAPLVKKTAPAVVNIYTAKTVRTRQVSPLFNDPFFRRFFGDRVPSAAGPKRKV